ncbi:MAG: hypothetical protein NTV03_00300 [Candidatus Nomurabacteria bacterium]|nr:hypothetical protein [Candidatus Nomurabacteria bacterium]
MEDIEDIKNKIKSAVKKSMPDILQLLHLNVNERTISCLISSSLRDLSTEELSVDSEYDRHIDKEKIMSLKEYAEKYRNNLNEKEKFDCACEDCRKIKSNKEFEDTEYSKRPDIVIHKRNSDDKNNVVIEVKKNKKCLWDYLRLRYMTSLDEGYGYKLGIFIYFPDDKTEYIYFINGEKN